MLPRLQDLLVEAAGHGTGPGIMQDYLDEFSGKLAGLLPANFTPQGSGPLKVLVYYPADAPSEVIKGYLKSSINLPVGPRITDDYRNTKTESISVVLFRTAHGRHRGRTRSATCCGGGRARWPGRSRPTCCAGGSGPATTSATWPPARSTGSRSCTGCCARCGTARATIEGPEASPERLNVELGGGVTMTLPLTPLGQASSWGSLLRAYELWALDDDDIHRRFCGQLMRELPDGPRRPAAAADRAVPGGPGSAPRDRSSSSTT